MGLVRLDNSGESQSSPRRQLAAALTRAVLDAERQRGRAISRTDLATRVNVSVASLYAYLNGTTLPRGLTFERLLDELGVSGSRRGRLGTLRDSAEITQRIAREVHPNPSDLPRPQQLPPSTRHFVGRAKELASLLAATSQPRPDAAPVCVVDGPAGVGKTTIAIHFGHLVEQHYPDGQLYADLRGFGPSPPADPAETLLDFLVAIGIPVAAIPPTLAARSALYRSAIAGKRMLIVVDNAATSAQVRPLLPPTTGCSLLVTSRNRLDSLVARDGAARVELAVLEPMGATELLAARIGPSRVAAEQDAVHALVELCAGLPLALCVVAARAADRPSDPLAALVDELRDDDDRLDYLSSREDDLDLRTVFRWSYDALEPATARLFRLLGLHYGPDIGLAACAALAGTAEPPRRALQELLSANLLTERPRGRFRMHELLLAFARRLPAGSDHKDDPAEVLRRVLDHYLEAAEAVYARIQPDDVEKRADVRPASMSYAAAMAWFSAEHEVLLAQVQIAAERGFDFQAWRLAWACVVFLRRSGRHSARVAVMRTALSAAERAGDRAAAATSRRMLADALARSRDGRDVRPLLAAALADFEDLEDDSGALCAHLSLVRALGAGVDEDAALEHAEAALRIAESMADPAALADALAATAGQLAWAGRTSIALDRCAQALEMYTTTGNTEGQASVLKIVGDIELRSDRPRRAITALERSLALDRALGDRYWAAYALHRLAKAHLALGDQHTADRLRAEGAAMLTAIGHPDAALFRA